MPSPLKSRRQFLAALSLSGSAALLGISCIPRMPPEALPPGSGGPAPLPDGLNRSDFHVHNERPLALETRRARLTSAALTPASLLFVRNNLPMPARSIVENPDKWVLEVLGTARTAALSLADLKSLGRDTVTAVLQCSGNGRAFFGHNPSGSPWAVGAAGCVNWTGIAVSKVAAHLGGALEGMRFVTATGGEEIPEGIDELAAVVERSIPLEKGLGDCLLAWEMNGQPIPLTHGGPLRLVVPGYFGCNQIKYVKKLAFAESQSEAKIQKKGYRFRPLGENGGPAQPSMWRMPVKSWINGPGAEEVPVLAGTVRFHGVAFSGERGIESVEVSQDGGRTWRDAEIVGPDMGPNAWRTFQFSTELGPGLHTVVSRATDKHGDIQPERREENERGYGYNAWRDAGLQVEAVAALSSQSTQETPSAAPPPTQATREEVKLTESGARGRQVFTEQSNPPCGSCHTLLDAETVGAIGPDLDSLQPDLAGVDKAVTHGVGIMPSFGSTLTPREITDLANYVVEATR